MYTVSKLANEFNLSGSTLLYYDRIGLLSPSGRSESNYRLYSEDDAERLRKICMFREAGVTLLRYKIFLSLKHSSARCLT